MESKALENRNKPAIVSPDIVETADFVFSDSLHHNGDSGNLLLAKRKTDSNDQYLVKHAYTDCACNEFVYIKLAHAMEYCVPDAVLFRWSAGEKRSCFKTGYIIGERYLNVSEAFPAYEVIRPCLIIGGMTSGERFFRRSRQISAGILTDFKEI